MASAEGRRPRDPGLSIPPRRVAYADEESVENEFPAARQSLGASSEALAGIWSRISAKRNVTLGEVRDAIDPLVASILRNKDALVTLMRVQDLDRNTHEHCMALAVWGGLLGRQLGLAPREVKRLAFSCSLVDIGKIRLPKDILYRPGPLTDAEWPMIRAHVGHSLEMVDQMGDADPAVHEAVRWHHERMDGSGYPDGLQGSAIPMSARVAGIVDSYDAMISQRPYASTRSSHQALVDLQQHAPSHYQPELIEQFAQAIGLFPNGALVELSTGEVAVVCGQNPGTRLRPKVMLILDEQKRRRANLLIIDLKHEDNEETRIKRELARHEFGVDAKEYFL
jgi:HD-GYP domain-containing protein (c-di-GMP phosphodiesterase class II)